MFPSKFLQFPSILTHFHAANEKIQNGGRDLAISRGLVWVKTIFHNRIKSRLYNKKATLTLAVIIALSRVTTEQHVATGSPYNAGTVVNGVTNQTYAHVTSIIENSPKKGRRTIQPMPRIMTSCVMAHLKMLSLKTAFPVATMPAAIETAAWKSVTTVLLLREIIIVLMLMIITRCLSLNSHWLINRFGNILA